MSKICKVLLVEDQQEIQDLLRELFADEGYRFVVVGDGEAMRETLRRESDIDVVVIDVLLPGAVDGLTLAKEVADQGLPVIVVTGDHQKIEKLDRSGHRYLLKPFRLSSFIEMIEVILAETRNHCVREKRAAEDSKLGV